MNMGGRPHYGPVASFFKPHRVRGCELMGFSAILGEWK